MVVVVGPEPSLAEMVEERVLVLGVELAGEQVVVEVEQQHEELQVEVELIFLFVAF